MQSHVLWRRPRIPAVTDQESFFLISLQQKFTFPSSLNSVTNVDLNKELWGIDFIIYAMSYISLILVTGENEAMEIKCRIG